MVEKLVKKKDRARLFIAKNADIFKCPVCKQKMVMTELHMMICEDNHSFDLAKKGYLNLLTGCNAPKYSNELFEARHKVCAAGLYDPLIEQLCVIINEHKSFKKNSSLKVLDAGCGEGSLVYDIQKRTNDNNITFVGVDISKDGINIASRNDSDLIWCVADLARLPFVDHSFDVILNILTPANYSEFNRILRTDGIIVKVVPGKHYLKELREVLYERPSSYSNHEVTAHFNQNLTRTKTYNINYQFAISPELFPHLLRMTPLSWAKGHEKLGSLKPQDLTVITVELEILTGFSKS